MAAFTATWTTTEATDWTAGLAVRETKFKQQVGQNIEYLKAAVDGLTSNQFFDLYLHHLQSGAGIGHSIA